MRNIVLIHGFPLDATMWDSQAHALSKAGHQVLLPEIGGLGSSTIPDSEPDIHAMAAQVADAMQVAHMERAVIGGLSMGGYVAMALLRVAPERVAGLMLLDTKASADEPERRATRMQIAANVRAGNSVESLARTMPATLISDVSEDSQPGLRANVAEMIRRASPTSVAWCQEAMSSRPDSLTTLRSSGAMPSLVLCGSEDSVTPPSDHEQLIAALRDSGGQPKYVVVPGAGHLPPLENPTAVNAAMMEFLGSI